MRLAIEIDRWEDLITLKELLNGNGLIKLNEDLPQQTFESAAEYTARQPEKAQGAKAAPKKAPAGKPDTKPAEKPADAQTAPAGDTAPANGSDEATGKPEQEEPPLDQSNPFADEVEEEKAPKKPKKLSREDVTTAFTQYISTFGQAAGMSDITVMLQEAFGVSKIKDIPNNQDAFSKAVVLVAEAIENNPYERERV